MRQQPHPYRFFGDWLSVSPDLATRYAAVHGHLQCPGLNWTALMAFANDHLLVVWLSDALAGEQVWWGVPADVRDYLRFLGERNRERNARLAAQTLEACAALNAGGLEPMLLKGVAELFDTPTVQPVVGDLDIMVQAGQAAAATEVLREIGYSVVRGVHPTEHGYADLYRPQDAAVIDLHRHPLALANLLPAAPMWEASRAVTICGTRFRVPAPSDQMLCRVLHDQVQDKTLGTAEMHLRSVYQVAQLMVRYTGQVDWGDLTRRMRPHGLTLALSLSLLAAHDLFGTPMPAEVPSGRWTRLLHKRRLLRLRYPPLGRLNNAIGNAWRPFARYRYTPLATGAAGELALLRLRVRHGFPELAQYGRVLLQKHVMHNFATRRR